MYVLMSNPSSSAKTTESPDGQDPATFGGRVTLQIGAGMSSAALGWESWGVPGIAGIV
jgi:hypothetical protein